MRRRTGVALIAAGAVLALCCGGGAVAAVVAWTGADLDTTGKVDFRNALAVPPLAESRVDGEGRRVFDLRAQEGRTDLGQGRPTRTWGFNGDHLGPTLRAKRGERVLVNVVNGLAEPTSVHWHGMHLPARMDGGPHQEVRPGATWSPTWTVDQPAATLWYHPHPHGQTARHVQRGLAGMFILDDEPTRKLALPHDYGTDDIPVIVQDRSFDGDGQIEDGGGTGDTVLVNGTVAPYLDVRTERVRLRLLNASAARTYSFGLSDGRRFTLIGTDGGLLPAPHDMSRIRLSPGERAEIIVAFRPDERVTLRSYPADLDNPVTDRFGGGRDTLDVLQLRTESNLAPSPAVPAALAPIERLDPGEAVKTREFTLSGRQINGKKMDMSRIDAVVTKDTTEVWEITKEDGTAHSFHVHDVQFQVLSVGGAPPPAELSGWKDTVLLAPNETVKIIARFADYADPDVPYMYHCHVLKHEDAGMMGQFVVVEPGQKAGRPATHGDHESHG
ncbi:multicopper oxidase family protein [Phytohabitans houttuyneae]|uniref:multicopper oxidase family protein n=1 Tax=Phytohabitans houttuyneae TaxID=1076126 RepID=UPI0015674285|nr:multicopper oxidase domain-containing protein [Phytohabitans houttuyneae]